MPSTVILFFLFFCIPAFRHRRIMPLVSMISTQKTVVKLSVFKVLLGAYVVWDPLAYSGNISMIFCGVRQWSSSNSCILWEVYLLIICLFFSRMRHKLKLLLTIHVLAIKIPKKNRGWSYTFMPFSILFIFFTYFEKPSHTSYVLKWSFIFQ